MSTETSTPAARTVIVYNGEPHDFGEAKLGDLIAFERMFGVKATALQPKPKFDEHGQAVYNEKDEQVMEPADISLEWLAFLFWRALRRQGGIGKDVAFDDDFLDGIDSIEQVDADGEASDADPSVPGQPPG